MEDPGIPEWISNVARTPDQGCQAGETDPLWPKTFHNPRDILTQDWELHDEFWTIEDDEYEYYDEDEDYYYGFVPTMGLAPSRNVKQAKAETATVNSDKQNAELSAHIKTNEIRTSIFYVESKLSMSKTEINARKNIEARHRNLAELLHTKVNLRGALLTFLIGAVSCLSVFYIKTLFGDNTRGFVYKPI